VGLLLGEDARRRGARLRRLTVRPHLRARQGPPERGAAAAARAQAAARRGRDLHQRAVRGRAHRDGGLRREPRQHGLARQAHRGAHAAAAARRLARGHLRRAAQGAPRDGRELRQDAQGEHRPQPLPHRRAAADAGRAQGRVHLEPDQVRLRRLPPLARGLHRRGQRLARAGQAAGRPRRRLRVRLRRRGALLPLRGRAGRQAAPHHRRPGRDPRARGRPERADGALRRQAHQALRRGRRARRQGHALRRGRGHEDALPAARERGGAHLARQGARRAHQRGRGPGAAAAR